ncbi:uncharacterized protein BO95DRAFT_238509 [Aspergillus brunneoviolaceus CBS 621.78]|uniref:Uncharacterized protein n=1 Tax=Aspergillus brunneoviolaceus CBS 621.78 TaxID=1450534 RepID=A0ACD1FZJ8_9EURO|nr:hypothetical protein BO95DRAFT_238509 [Aspergillus brunneoviolaceus CBS 621.78]RAH42363.1 hypothetical protein BO95DRAFT_238509 [Aspergillus brunneoviolaceus CBS 621.78]
MTQPSNDAMNIITIDEATNRREGSAWPSVLASASIFPLLTALLSVCHIHTLPVFPTKLNLGRFFSYLSEFSHPHSLDVSLMVSLRPSLLDSGLTIVWPLFPSVPVSCP